MIASKMKQSSKNILVDIPDPIDEVGKNQGEPAAKLETIPLGDNPEKIVQIELNLESDLRDKMIKFLQANTDVFAWLASDMPGIPVNMIIYKLNIDPSSRPVQQKKWSFAPER